MKKVYAIALLAGLAGSAASVSAATIWSDDFESYSTGAATSVASNWGAGGPPLGLWYSSSNLGALTTTNASFAIDNNGVSGSKGLTFSITDKAGLDWWAAQTISAIDLMSPIGAGTSLSSVQLNFTVLASGMIGTRDVEVQLVQHDGAIYPQLAKTFTIANGTNNLSALLSDFTSSVGSWNPELTSSFRMGEFYGNPTVGFGMNPGDHVTLDNVSLNSIPEPTSLAILSLAGLWGLRRRRA